MVPIHDTDIAEERWAQGSWRHYELWEKVEVRLRRRRQLWILGTAALFMLLSAVPIVRERYPRWQAQVATRRLAVEIGRMKAAAAHDRAAHRLRFTDASQLIYVLETAPSCKSPQSEWQPLGTQSLSASTGGWSSGLAVVTRADASRLGLSQVVDEVCYDSHAGAVSPHVRTPGEIGFAFIPVRDLVDHRVDRVAALIVSGLSAQLSLE